ncbi:acetylcholine receptor subunit gamma [Biomphalaria glabrata]|nr:acetylcholine receptor subunit gamma [Biomphalaria glabrata]
MAKVATHIVILLVLDVQSQSYQETVTLLEDKLNPESYRPEVRPQRNQSSIMEVVVQFALLSIVGIDDLAQSFTCNGYFVFGWMDEVWTCVRMLHIGMHA